MRRPGVGRDPVRTWPRARAAAVPLSLNAPTSRAHWVRIPGFPMLENLGAVWRLMRHSALDYALAVLAMVIASMFLFAAPLIPQAVIDGVLMPNDDPGVLVRLPIDLLGGADFVRDHLWVADQRRRR